MAGRQQLKNSPGHEITKCVVVLRKEVRNSLTRQGVQKTRGSHRKKPGSREEEGMNFSLCSDAVVRR